MSKTYHHSKEFRDKYEGTWILVSISGKEPKMQYIKEVQVHDSGKRVDFDVVMVSKTYEDDAVVEYPDIEVIPFLPNERLTTDFHGDVFLYSRNPAKQWKRGLCHDNGVLINPIRDFLDPLMAYSTQKGSHAGFGVSSFPLIHGLSRNYKRNLSEAASELAHKPTSILNNHWFISVPIAPSFDFTVWRHRHPVANVNRSFDKAELEMITPVFKQECFDLFNRMSIHPELKV